MGRTISVISDGMGTGGRAAVDGNMAVGILTKLVKAGLSLDCSLNIVNSALIIKSDEESLLWMSVKGSICGWKQRVQDSGLCLL